jgi:hypothetical protein
MDYSGGSCEQSQTFRFYKMQEISLLSGKLLDFQDSAPCGMLVNWVYKSMLQ